MESEDYKKGKEIMKDAVEHSFARLCLDRQSSTHGMA